jgi:hypothetical protein
MYAWIKLRLWQNLTNNRKFALLSELFLTFLIKVLLCSLVSGWCLNPLNIYIKFKTFFIMALLLVFRVASFWHFIYICTCSKIHLISCSVLGTVISSEVTCGLFRHSCQSLLLYIFPIAFIILRKRCCEFRKSKLKSV